VRLRGRSEYNSVQRGHLYIAAGGLVFVKISFSFLIFKNNCISVAS
jgi:hypothetical protein